MLLPRATANNNAEPATQAGDAMSDSAATSNISLRRREQLARLEQGAAHELLELRAKRDQALAPAPEESNDWLKTSIDWDLSVP